MTTLISAEWYKIIRSKALMLILIGVAITSIIGINGNISRDDITNLTEAGVEELAESGTLMGQTGVNLISLLTIFIMIWIAAFVGFFVANEFQNGTMRNVLALGKNRTQVFFAKLFSTCIAVAAMLIVTGLIGTVGAQLAFGFGDMSFWDYIRYLSVYLPTQLLLHCTFAAIFCLIAFLSRNVGLSILLSVGYCIVSTIVIGFCGQFKNLAFVPLLFPNGYVYYISQYATDPDFVQKTLLVGLVHLLIPCIIGCLAFKKADVV